MVARKKIKSGGRRRSRLSTNRANMGVTQPQSSLQLENYLGHRQQRRQLNSTITNSKRYTGHANNLAIAFSKLPEIHSNHIRGTRYADALYKSQPRNLYGDRPNPVDYSSRNVQTGLAIATGLVTLGVDVFRGEKQHVIDQAQDTLETYYH